MDLATYTKAQWAGTVDGLELDEDSWLEARVRNEVIDKQTKTLSKMLFEAGDDNIYNGNETIHMVSPFGSFELLSASLANRNILPDAQQRNARKYAQALEYWLEHRKNQGRTPRMWVISIGKPVEVPDFQDRLKELNYKIRKKLNPLIRHQYGIDVDFIRPEWTQKRNELGKMTYHIHAHIVVTPRYRMSKKRWKKLLRSSKSVTHAHIHDSKLRKGAECAKYMCKISPGEVDTDQGKTLGLIDHTPSELFELAKATYKKQLMRPVGEFADFLKQLKEDKKELKKFPEYDPQTDVTVWRWCFVQKKTSQKAKYAKTSESTPANIILGYKMAALARPKLDKYLVVRGFTTFEECCEMRGIDAEDWHRFREKESAPEGEEAYAHTSTITVPSETEQDQFIDPITRHEQHLATVFGGYDPPT